MDKARLDAGLGEGSLYRLLEGAGRAREVRYRDGALAGEPMTARQCADRVHGEEGHNIYAGVTDARTRQADFALP